jgi:hypothetical protein
MPSCGASPPLFVAMKAPMGAADPTKGSHHADRDNETDHEPSHATSPTDHVLTELQLRGHRPFQDEPDPRPLPEARIVAAAVADIFDALIVSLSGRRPHREHRVRPNLRIVQNCSYRLVWGAALLHPVLDEYGMAEIEDM